MAGAARIGCTPETLRGWVGQQERDTGQRAGPTTAEEERVKALEPICKVMQVAPPGYWHHATQPYADPARNFGLIGAITGVKPGDALYLPPAGRVNIR